MKSRTKPYLKQQTVRQSKPPVDGLGAPRQCRNDNDAQSAADAIEMLRDWCRALGEVNGQLGTVVRVIRYWPGQDDQGGGVRAAREVRAILRRHGL
jgi:hypothetical protein